LQLCRARRIPPQYLSAGQLHATRIANSAAINIARKVKFEIQTNQSRK
jgi:hypothetical protein